MLDIISSVRFHAVFNLLNDLKTFLLALSGSMSMLHFKGRDSLAPSILFLSTGAVFSSVLFLLSYIYRAKIVSDSHKQSLRFFPVQGGKKERTLL